MLQLILLLSGIPRRWIPPTAFFRDRPGAAVSLRGTITQRTNTSTGIRLLLSHYSFLSIDTFDEWAATVPDREARRYFADSGTWEIAVLVSDSPEGLLPGREVIITGVCSLPDVPTCPGVFDSRAYWRARKVLLEISDPSAIKLLETPMQGATTGIRGLLREYSPTVILSRLGAIIGGRLASGIDAVFSREDAGILRALTLGDRSGLDREQRQLFADGGISHILAISALHLSILCMGLYRLLRRSGFLLPASCLSASLFACTYCLMTGMSISAKRALILFLFRMGAELLGRRVDRITALGAAAVLLTLDCPYVLTDSSFLLSFACVLSIEFLAPVFRPQSSIADLVSLSAAVWFGTLPLTMYFFYQVTPYSIFISLLVLPPLGALMLCALLAGLCGVFCIPLGTVAAVPCHLILSVFRGACRVERLLPGAVFVTGRPALWQIFLYYLSAAAACAVCRKRSGAACTPARAGARPARGGRKAWVCFAAALICLFLRFPPAFRISFLDVGQGDAILIEAAGSRFLIDAGSSQIRSVWEDRIEPALKYRGIRRLDGVFLTHGDHDHISGIEEYLKASCRTLTGTDASGITADTLVFSGCAPQDPGLMDLKALASSKNVQVRIMDAGSVLRKRGWSLTCLYPRAGESTGDPNQDSLVLLGVFGGLRVLFTGDLENEGEERLLGVLKAQGAGTAAGQAAGGSAGAASSRMADILKIGHHGSANATSESLLALLNPAAAVISCGKNNAYGHPSDEVLQRLQTAGCRVLRTDLQGSVILTVSGKGSVRVTTWPP